MMQRKYVYLFELDSVRDSDDEVIAGQAAIYDEIVRKGNTVVLTYNQLVDSRAFFSLMTDEAYYRNILQLFEQGCIRISQFGDIRTVAQYILSTVDANKRFIYSALPLKFTQKRLIALVQRSLVYSDLSEIREYMEGGRRSDEDVEDLFIELERDDAGNVKRISMDGDGEDVAMHRDILKNLYSFLSIILRLSMLHDVYIAPRKASEIAPFRFHHVLQCVLRLSMSSIPQWEEVRAILQDLPAFRAGQNGRSRYHRDLYRQFHDGGLADAQRQAYSLAEAVVDLCYNYVCEISICNISKHYNVEELRELDSPKPTFAADFMRRLQIVWDRGNQVKSRFLREETNRFVPFKQKDRLPDFSEAVRMAEYTRGCQLSEAESVPRYEYEEMEQQRGHRQAIFSGIGQKLFFSFICLLAACGVKFAFQDMKHVLDHFMNVGTAVFSIAETILFLLFTEWISNVLAAHCPVFVPLSKALGSMYTLLRDAWHTFCMPRAVSAASPGAEVSEARSQETPIDFITPKELRDYQAYRKRHGGLFAPSDEIPIADTGDRAVVRKLVRSMELYHQEFGMVYQSRYNTFLVDPIAKADGTYYPFERVLPTAGNGVVIAAMRAEKFVLLKQYRHALRAEQYSFPRGYAEPGTAPLENIRRELAEELHATVMHAPQSLGFLEPDSGLTSRRIEVFLVELDDYQANIGHEGILEVREVSPEDLAQMIENGTVSDGYTIGAMELWQLKNAS